MAQGDERLRDIEVDGGRFGGGEVEAVGEDAEVAEEPLFVVGEEVVGPADRLSQRAVAAVAEEIERAGRVARGGPRGRTRTGEPRPVGWPGASRRGDGRSSVMVTSSAGPRPRAGWTLVARSTNTATAGERAMLSRSEGWVSGERREPQPLFGG